MSPLTRRFLRDMALALFVVGPLLAVLAWVLGVRP